MERSQFYNNWQRQLLRREISTKENQVKHFETARRNIGLELKNIVSFLDFNCLLHFLDRNINNYIKDVKHVHAKKLYELGANLNIPTCDPDKVVINHSNYLLSKKEKSLLAFGLDHCILPKFSKLKYFLAFEILYNKVKDLPFYNTNSINFGTCLKTIAYKFMKTCRSEKVQTIISENDQNLLKNLGKNESLHITRPDKGKGVVILNKIDYVNKMENLLNDRNNFKDHSHEDPLIKTIRSEDKINRNLKKLKEKNVITEDEYKQLYATGSSPGIMYGLPKIHKQGVPLRPILSSMKTPNYKLSKFLIPHINHLATNDYTLRNSKEFFNFVTSIRLPSTSIMASFDIESLYTNIPIKETIKIITDSVYENGNTFRNLSKKEFTQLLSLVTEDNFFVFNSRYLKQTEGLSMGNPVSATFANIFMSFHEQKWLSSCPQDFKPLVYKRYVDDTFLIFEKEEHILPFFNYLNAQHEKIKFTMEKESNKRLPFLNLLIEKDHSGINVSIFRKPTFTGLGINFLSACFDKYKTNTIMTLLHRAYNLTSTYTAFHKEITFLHSFFKSNGFNSNLFYSYVRRFLDNKYDPPSQKCGPKKQILYLRFPYISRYLNKTLCNEIKGLFQLYLPQIDLRFAIYNNLKIKSFFQCKESLPSGLCSSVVYQFTCSKCNLEYIGSSIKNLSLRVDQHRAVSSRTAVPLVRPLNSAIREHCESVCNMAVDKNSFRILTSSRSELELRILESMIIRLKKPSLNIDGSSFPLYIM